jgi:hypothetical protein
MDKLVAQEQAFLIPEPLLQAVLTYMASRPWSEVNGAMPRLLALRPAVVADFEPGPSPAE